MLAPKLELLGLNINQDMGDVEVTDGIRVWGTVRNINEILEEKGVKSGDKMLLFQSLRPSLEDLEDDVSQISLVNIKCLIQENRSWGY